MVDANHEGFCEGGGVTKVLNKHIHQQNGHIAADICTRHIAHAERSEDPLRFVFDFMLAQSCSFESLRYTLDAANKPFAQVPDEEFERIYGLPRRLSFSPSAGVRGPVVDICLDDVY